MTTSPPLPPSAQPAEVPPGVPLDVPGDVFSVHVTRRGPAAVVVARGEVDLSTVRELRRAVLDVVADPAGAPARTVAVDLSGVSFIDCTGLSGLLGCVEEAARAGVGVRLEGVSSQVSRLMALTGTGARLGSASAG